MGRKQEPATDPQRENSGNIIDKQETSSGQATDKQETSSGQATDKQETRSGQATDKQETRSGQATDKQETSSEQVTDKREINNGQITDKWRAASEQTADEQGRNSGSTVSRQGRIWETAQKLKPDFHKKQISLSYIQGAIESKQIHNTPFFSELMQIQLQYISPLFWILQGGLLLLLILFLHRLPKQGAELTDYLWWSSMVAAWMGVLSHGVLGKHFSNKMAELEQSCYINLTQMWIIRMILTTGVDIGILTVFSGGVASRTDTFFGRIAVYLLVPFVLSNVCCLLMISVIRGSRGKFAMAVLAVLTALLAMSPSVFPEIYTAAYLWVWFCLLLFGAVIFAGQLRSYYGRMTRGDLICWN